MQLERLIQIHGRNWFVIWSKVLLKISIEEQTEWFEELSTNQNVNFSLRPKKNCRFNRRRKVEWEMRVNASMHSGCKEKWEEKHIVSANRLTMENVDWFVVNKFHSEMQSPAMCIVLSSVSKNYFHFIPEFFIYCDQCSAGTHENERGENHAARGRCGDNDICRDWRRREWRRKKKQRESESETCKMLECRHKSAGWKLIREWRTRYAISKLKRNSNRILFIEY